MPAEQRGWIETLKSGEEDPPLLRQHRQGPTRALWHPGKVLRFKSKTAALNHHRDVIAPALRGDTTKPELTLREFVPIFLERHAVGVRDRTIATLRDRLGYPAERDDDTPEKRRERERHAVRAFGDVPLRELERMADEIAAWQVHLPSRARHGIVQALRQCLDAAVRWGHMDENPAKVAGKNPKAPHRTIPPVHVRRGRRGHRRGPHAGPLPGIAPRLAARPACAPRSGRCSSAAISTGATWSINVRRTLSSGEVVGLRQDRPQSPPSSDHRPGACRARRDCAAARHAAAVPRDPRRGAQPRQLASPGVGAGGRRRRRCQARPPLRHALDLREPRDLGRDQRRPTRPRDGHECGDDRGALRRAARRRRRRDRRPPRRLRRRTGGRS